MQETTEERRRRCRHWFPDNKRCDNYQFAAFCEEHIQRTAEFFEYKDKSKREHKETSSTESVEDAEGNKSLVQDGFTLIGFIFLFCAILDVAAFFELSRSINDCNKALDNLCGTFEIGNFTIIIIRILILGVGGLMLLGMGSEDNIKL